MEEETVVVVNAAVEEEKQEIDEDAILELAKRRLAIKNNLKGQVFEYAMIVFCLFLMLAFWDFGFQAFISFTIALVWGTRLLYRIIKFARPSFKGGIAAYLKKRNDYRLESEFNRLKKEYLNNN